MAERDEYATRFYLDCLLSIPAERTPERFRQRNQYEQNPLSRLRTSLLLGDAGHIQPAELSLIHSLALAGNTLAIRIAARELIVRGKPESAISLLNWSLIGKNPEMPPVEMLLLAKAYRILGKRDLAENQYRAAVQWQQSGKLPCLVANVLLSTGANIWSVLGVFASPKDDLRYSSQVWQAWHEYDILLKEVEANR